MVQNDPVHNCEAKADTLFAGCEIGFQKLAPILIGKSGACVFDFDHYILSTVFFRQLVSGLFISFYTLFDADNFVIIILSLTLSNTSVIEGLRKIESGKFKDENSDKSVFIHGGDSGRREHAPRSHRGEINITDYYNQLNQAAYELQQQQELQNSETQDNTESWTSFITHFTTPIFHISLTVFFIIFCMSL